MLALLLFAQAVLWILVGYLAGREAERKLSRQPETKRVEFGEDF